MGKKPTSSVVEEDAQDTAPSEKSVETTPPEKETEDQLFLMDEMDKLPDLDLVKIGLAAMVILHQRGEAAKIKTDDSE